MGIRWSQVEANDRTYAPRVTALIPAAAQTHTAVHSGHPRRLRNHPALASMPFTIALPASLLPKVELKIH